MEEKQKLFRHEKLRRTIIKGIPCRFIALPECPYIAEQRRLGKRKHSIYKEVDAQLMKASSEELNIRGGIWKLVCKTDEIKAKELARYKVRRNATKDENGQPTMPLILTAKELYHYYRSQNTPDIEHLLKKDLERTDLSNMDFKIDYKTNKNPLYNVLNAYAHYDSEVGYCQGMNIITSWLLKFLKDRKEWCVDSDERTPAMSEKTQEEVDAEFVCIFESNLKPPTSTN